MSEGMLNKVAEHFNVGDLPRVAYHKVFWGEAKQEMKEYTEQNGSDRRYLKDNETPLWLLTFHLPD